MKALISKDSEKIAKKHGLNSFIVGEQRNQRLPSHLKDTFSFTERRR
jgi:hypothetical protein